MSARSFELVAMAAVLGAAGIMASRRSPRAGLAVLGLYAAQAGCLAWASRTIDGAPWSTSTRVAFLAALLSVISHRIATYAYPRAPAARDRVVVPLVHVAQAWLFVELAVWPARALTLPASTTLDAWTLALPAALCPLALVWTHRRPVTTRHRVTLATLRAPLRVVHLSDLHLGPYLSESRLSWLADRVTAERGDLIALTGDFLTLRTQRDWSPLVQFVERLHAADGVFACLGNHDIEVADGLSETLRRRGVIVLRDAVAWLPGRDGRPPVAVAGLDWRTGRAAHRDYADSFAGLCRAAGPQGPAVVLCHQPSVFKVAPEGFGGIMLAGHLHGGQVGIHWGGKGASILRAFGMYDQGLFARGSGWLYSHRGTGVYGFPLRVGVPAEIAVIDLVPAGLTANLPGAGSAPDAFDGTVAAW